MSRPSGVKIPNPVNLNKKVPELPRSSALDPITRAEHALDKLSKTFNQWMIDEVARLDKIWKSIVDSGLDDESLTELYAVCHDIKGEGATFGFPLAGDVANSLCRLLDAFEKNPDAIPLKLTGQYVKAIKAIVKEKAQNAFDPIGRQLADELAARTDDVIAMLEKAKTSQQTG